MGSLPGEVLHWGLLLTSTAGLEKHEKKTKVSSRTQASPNASCTMGQDYEALAKNQPLCKHTLASHTITQHAPQSVHPGHLLLLPETTKARQESEGR